MDEEYVLFTVDMDVYEVMVILPIQNISVNHRKQVIENLKIVVIIQKSGMHLLQSVVRNKGMANFFRDPIRN
jgi:hypothetical protein